MAGHSLLQRIRNPQYASPRRAPSEADIRDSVLSNLKAICTTWQGTMLTCPDYGLVDVSELVHSFPDAIALMAKSIRVSIQKYEPRLTNVVIRHVPSETGDLTLRFEISAQLSTGDGRSRVKFETSLDAARKFDVR